MCDTQVVRCSCPSDRDNTIRTNTDTKAAVAEHSRTSSVGSADGLLLSVSALAGGKGKRVKDNSSSLVSPRSEEVSDAGGEDVKGVNTDVSDNSLSSESSYDVKGRVAMGQGESRREEKDMSKIVRMEPEGLDEYQAWKKAPTMSSSNIFLARIYKEDVDPCLDFPAKFLSLAVRQAIHDNILCLSPCKPDTGENPRNCALLEQPRTARYKLKIEGEGMQEEHFISQLARNRIAAVCDFLTYCRYVTQGMVKSPVNDVYWEVMELRRKMVNARLGFSI